MNMLMLLRLVCIYGFLVCCCYGQYQKYQGWCEKGGQTVTTSSLPSTTLVQASYPGCTVTVFLSGTTVSATIYSDISGTPLSNPFTADLTTGAWSFYIISSATPDIQLSGAGINPPFVIGGANNGSGVGVGGSNSYISSSAFIWQQKPGGTLTGGVSNGVVLSPCPLGVNPVDIPQPQHSYVLVTDGVGGTEVLMITGGSGSSGATTCTINISPVNNHSGSWTIGTATSGMQEADNYLPATGGTIYLPGSAITNYACTSIYNTGVSIVGSGVGWHNRVFFSGTDPIGSTLTMAANSNYPCVIYVQAMGTQLKNFEIDGACYPSGQGGICNQTGGTGYGVWVNNPNGGFNNILGYQYYENLQIGNTYGKGFYVQNSGVLHIGELNHVSIRDTRDSNFQIEGQDWSIVAANFGGTTLNGSSCIVCAACNRVEFIGGEVDSAAGDNIVLYNSGRVSFVNIKSENAGGDGLYAYNSGAMSATTDLTIHGGQFDGNGLSAPNTLAGIHLTGTLNNVEISGVRSGNIISGQTSQAFGIWIDNSASGGPVEIHDNNLNGNTSPPLYYQQGGGVEIFSYANMGVDDQTTTLNNPGTSITAPYIPNVVLTGSSPTNVNNLLNGWTGRQVLFMNSTNNTITFTTGGSSPNQIANTKAVGVGSSTVCKYLNSTTGWWCQ